MRRVLSLDAETKIKLPLGVKLRSLTTSWWPERFKSRSPRVKQQRSSQWARWRLVCQSQLHAPQPLMRTCTQASRICTSQKWPTCLHLPNLDLPIVESCGKDQARHVWYLGRVACPGLPAGWRRPWAEGQTPDNLPTVQSLLLWAASPFCIIFAASAFGFKPFRDAGGSREFLMSLKLSPS